MPLPPPGIIDEIPSNPEGETPSEPETEGEAPAAPEQQPELLPENEPTSQPEAAPAVPMAELTAANTAVVGSVCTIGDVGYTSLAEAFAAAKSGDRIVLTSSVEVADVIEIHESVTLDLNGFTVSNLVEKDRLFHVYAPTFTVEGTKAGSRMKIPTNNTASYGFIKIVSASDITLNSGSYIGNTDNGAFFKNFSTSNYGTLLLYGVEAESNNRIYDSNTVSADETGSLLEVIGGHYKSDTIIFATDTIKPIPITFKNVIAHAKRGPVIEVCGSDATFENCDFTVSPGIGNWQSDAIGVSYCGIATIKNGTYTSDAYGVCIYSSGGTINIEGGTVIGKMASVYTTADTETYPSAMSSVSISGGNISGDFKYSKDQDMSRQKIEVTGGTFDRVVADEYLAPGYVCKKSGSGFIVVDEGSDVVVDAESSAPLDSVEALPESAPEEVKDTFNEAKTDLLSNDNPAATTAPEGLEHAVMPEKAIEFAKENGFATIEVVLSSTLEKIEAEEITNTDGSKSAVITSVQFDVEPKWKVGSETGPITDLGGKSVTFRLPIPKSVTERYARVQHPSDADRYLEIQKAEDGQQFIELTADHFSPFTITFTNKLPSSGSSSSSDGGKSFAQRNSDFWEEVRQSIEDAKDGDVIKVNAKNYDRMSWTVMRELERNEGVSLVIRWNGGEEIVIPAGKAQSSESTRIYWPLSMLEELYAEASLTAPETGKPSTPDKANPSTGR